MTEQEQPFLTKTALITGSSRGIGRAIALALAERGADIIVHYLRKKQAAQEVVAQIHQLGRRAIAVRANLAYPSQLQGAFNEIEANFSPPDIFVGNAASGTPRPVLELNDKHWDWTMDVNARSILHCVQWAAPHMVPQGWGRIINLTSPGGQRVIPHYGAIGLSKAVVESLTRYLAADLARHGITVNAVSPGMVETEALNAFPVEVQTALATAKAGTPAQRLVTPAEVAELVAFLCTDQANMIIGQTLTIDGGYSIMM